MSDIIIPSIELNITIPKDRSTYHFKCNNCGKLNGQKFIDRSDEYTGKVPKQSVINQGPDSPGMITYFRNLEMYHVYKLEKIDLPSGDSAYVCGFCKVIIQFVRQI